MSGKLNVYRFGLGGVNLTKQPLQLADDEASQIQNAELVYDANIGGFSALTKRGGLSALTSALSSNVYGIVGVQLAGTYTRTLYAARGTATASTFRTSTDGTTWTNTSTPTQPASIAKYVDQNDALAARRMAPFHNLLFYAGDSYTKGTTNPILVVWDGTTSTTVTTLAGGPEATAGIAFVITDVFQADGKIWIAQHDDGDAAPNNSGRVVSLDFDSGEILQACEPFGTGAGLQQTGGAPCSLAFYQNQLFVGQNHESTTDVIGKISRCYPFVDTQWSADVTNLSGNPVSMAVFNGQLYAGTQSSAVTAEQVYVRSSATNAYTASFTGVGAGANARCTSLIVYSNELYAVQYHETAPTIHIKKFDGSSWTTDRDVDSSDGAVAGNTPGQACILGSDLFIVFRATTATATDGFIMRKSGGTWTKVDPTVNLSGPISVLVTRS